MSRRYEFAMNKPKKRKKKGVRMDGLDFQTFGFNKGVDSEEPQKAAAPPVPVQDWPDLPSTEEPPLLDITAIKKEPSQVGDELGTIKDRISKLLTDYESMYEQPDEEGNIFTVEDSVTGQLAIENLMSDYRSLCREREDLLESLQDSLDVDEDEVLDELEALRNQSEVDVDVIQESIKETFKNVHNTSDRLQAVNKRIVDMSKEGKATERLVQEKEELERELHMYKKMALQQRREFMPPRRASVSRGPGEGAQWKMVAGEMVDILKSVRHDGRVDRESLERELNKVLLTLNQQGEIIDGMKRDIQKQEKNAKGLEREKNRIFNEKLMVDDELERRKRELKQCKKYLKEVIKEKKEAEGKLSFEGGEIDLEEDVDEPAVGPRAPVEGGKAHAELLQAQMRDARNKIFKLEEENKDLQRQLEGRPKEKTEAKVEVTRKPSHPSAKISAASGTCPSCDTYKARLVNLREEQQSSEDAMERLKSDNLALRVKLKTSQKDIEDMKMLLEKVKAQEPKIVEVAIAEAAAQSPKEPEEPSPEKSPEPKEQEKTQPQGHKKVDSLKIPKKVERKKSSKRIAGAGKTSKPKKETKEKEKEKETETETTAASKFPPAKGKTTGRLVLGECREEKAAYVKVREAKMLSLSDKGTQTTYYGRLRFTSGNEAAGRRDNVGGYRRHARKNSLAAGVLAGVNPEELGHETVSAEMIIQDEIDRLCDEISGFVEFGLELVQQEAKCLQIKAETQLGTEKAAEILGFDYAQQGVGKQKSPKWPMTEHRRISVTSHGRRKSNILQLESRLKGDKRRSSSLSEPRQPLQEHEEEVHKQSTGVQPPALDQPHASEAQPPASDQPQATDGFTQQVPTTVVSGEVQSAVSGESVDGADQRSRAETDPGTGAQIHVSVATGEAGSRSEQAQMASKQPHVSKWWKMKQFFALLQTMKGGGCSHVFQEMREAEICLGEVIPSAEDQLKEQVVVMARHALELIETSGSLVTRQLNEQLSAYERFFQYWHEIRESRKEDMGTVQPDDVPITGTKVLPSMTLQDRSLQSGIPEENDQETDMGFALPRLPIPQQLSTINRKGAAVATAGLSKSGMMMISGGSIRSDLPPTPQVKKRTKPASKSRHHQQVQSQRSMIERVLSVSNKMDNIQNLLATVLPRTGIPKAKLSAYTEDLQPDNLPIIAMTSLVKPKAREPAQLQPQENSQLSAPAISPPRGPTASELLPGLLQFSKSSKVWDRKMSFAQPGKDIKPKSNEMATKFPALSVGGSMWKVS